MKTWRPEDWIGEISFEELSKISPSLVSMMTIKEKKIFEAGADAMLKAVRMGGLPTSPQMPNILELWTLGCDPAIRRQVIIEKPSRVVVIPDDPL